MRYQRSVSWKTRHKKKIDQYKNDLRFFRDLRHSVQRRYAEVIDFSEYEPKIKKLIDTYVGTGEKVEQITKQINIFDREEFAKEVKKLKGNAAKADTIAHRTMRTITERMQEDPAFYRKFSELLRETIMAFSEERMKDAEYLKRVTNIMNSVINRTDDTVPESLKYQETAKAYYGVVRETMTKYETKDSSMSKAAEKTSLIIDEIIRRLRIVNWVSNTDVQNQMRNKIEDILFEMKNEYHPDITYEDIDSIMEQCLDIAKVRIP